MKNIAKFGSSQIRLLVVMYFAYAVTMIMRQSLMAISPELIADPAVGLTKTDFGKILAYGNLGGMTGKMIFGWSTDKFGGKSNFLVALISVALYLILFGLNTDFTGFCVIFFLIAVSKSGGWPSLAKLIENWYHPSQYGRVWGAISTSSRIGTIIATMGFGYLLRYLTWSQTLYVAAAVGLSFATVWFIFVTEKPDEQVVEGSFDNEIDHSEHKFFNKTVGYALLDFSKSLRVWLIFLAMMGLTVMMNFLDFVPMFLKETLNISTSDAVMAASAFPFGSFMAVLIGGYIFDALSPKAITRVMGVLMIISVLCMVLILNLDKLGLAADQNLTLVQACLFVFGFSISPSYYLPMSIFSIKYGGPFSGALISLLDLGGYLASAISSFTVGYVADLPNGWYKVILMLIAIGLVTSTLTILFLHGEAKEEEKQELAV
ncbi:MAG: MFS transporter [Candidatus Cloacimonetes bacterium]|nr:MFS transporter [Candidatus Cloacimonadota bacterium]